MRNPTIDKERFGRIKAISKAPGTAKVIAARAGVSMETLRKVKNSKTFAEYQAQNKKSHGSTPSNTYTAPQPKVDKRGFWARLFNI